MAPLLLSDLFQFTQKNVVLEMTSGFLEQPGETIKPNVAGISLFRMWNLEQ